MKLLFKLPLQLLPFSVLGYFQSKSSSSSKPINFSWDRLLALYAADATSFYQLQYEHDELERVITDKGETWVNAWGVLHFVFPGRKTPLPYPYM